MRDGERLHSGLESGKEEFWKLSAHVAPNAVGIEIICSIRQQARAVQEVATRSSLHSLRYLSSCPRACSMPTYIIHPPGAVCDMKLKLNWRNIFSLLFLFEQQPQLRRRRRRRRRENNPTHNDVLGMFNYIGWYSKKKRRDELKYRFVYAMAV